MNGSSQPKSCGTARPEVKGKVCNRCGEALSTGTIKVSTVYEGAFFRCRCGSYCILKEGE